MSMKPGMDKDASGNSSSSESRNISQSPVAFLAPSALAKVEPPFCCLAPNFKMPLVSSAAYRRLIAATVPSVEASSMTTTSLSPTERANASELAIERCTATCLLNVGVMIEKRIRVSTSVVFPLAQAVFGSDPHEHHISLRKQRQQSSQWSVEAET